VGQILYLKPVLLQINQDIICFKNDYYCN